ncbi:ribonuclease III domain-containing protein [Desarmillaria ectypa]|nr:ribonuclease III domain-containing protein [Desarmillaria ectypa]
MGHASKRLVTNASRLASVSTSHLPKFPPKEALFLRDQEIPQPEFEPEIWASLQPPPPSALSAFASRIGLSSVLSTTELIQQTCTHSSFVAFYQHYYPSEPAPISNAQLATIGNSLMGLFATEHINATYPYLPTRVLKAAITAHVGSMTCASVANEMGAAPLLRWRRTPNTPNRPGVLHPDALSSIPRAITALIYQKRSLLSARKFVQSYFLTREIDLRNMIKFRDPKAALLEMVAKFGAERPKSRLAIVVFILLRETGRFSRAPVFVVGVFSGEDQLGEGFGSSLKMAEYRAAEDALLRVYLTRTPSHLVQLPTSTFSQSLGDVFQAAPEGEYIPPGLVASEIVYESSGKSGAAPGITSQS